MVNQSKISCETINEQNICYFQGYLLKLNMLFYGETCASIAQ